MPVPDLEDPASDPQQFPGLLLRHGRAMPVSASGSLWRQARHGLRMTEASRPFGVCVFRDNPDREILRAGVTLKRCANNLGFDANHMHPMLFPETGTKCHQSVIGVSLIAAVAMMALFAQPR